MITILLHDHHIIAQILCFCMITILLHYYYIIARSPSFIFQSNKVLRLSDGIENLGEIQWHLALILLQGWIVIFWVLIKGVNSLGKVELNMQNKQF